MYRQGGYFKTVQAPVSVRISSLNLSASESLEFWDPQRLATHPDEYELATRGIPPSFVEYTDPDSGRQSKLLASFSGTRVTHAPFPQLASLSSELRGVQRMLRL